MKCPYCESKNVIKSGKRRLKYVTKQGYRCKDCKRFFIERDGFEGMTYPKEIIVAVLHLFVEGLSLSKIREYMYQHHGYRVSDGSILNWVRKYANLMEKFEREQMPKPKVKGRIHLDEV
jgi:transposase-like protein